MSGWETAGTKPKTFVSLLDEHIIEMKMSEEVVSQRLKKKKKEGTYSNQILSLEKSTGEKK